MAVARCRTLLAVAAVAFAVALPLPARAVDYTDIWWAAGGVESGWGVNLAQNGGTIFATFYLYDTTKAPVWYTALLRRTVGETFIGDMFATTGGTWFGAPVWVPPVPAGTKVGTVTFIGQTPYRGTLTYTIGAVPVAKTIERYTLDVLVVTGTYLGAITARRAGCPGPSTIFDNVQFLVTQSAAPGTITVDQLSTTDGSFICRMQGSGTQYGGVIDVPSATYTCSGGLDATAHIIGLRPTATGFEGRWFTDFGNGCTETGNLSGATQSP